MKPGYKRTEAGVIPEDWEVDSIGGVFRLINGCAFKPEDWRDQGTPIIRIQNLNDPGAPFNYSSAPVADKHRVEPGDLLFAWSGTTGTSFGARVWRGPHGVLNQHIFKVITNQRKLAPTFSFLILQRIQADIEKKAHGFKSSFVHVKKSDLTRVPLPVPPLGEQRSIAAALGDMDQLIGALDQLIAKKSDLKQAATQRLLTGRDRLPGFHSEWEMRRLGQVADVDLCNLGVNTAPTYAFNYIALEDIDSGVLKGYSELVYCDAPSRARRVLRKGDVLVSTVRPNLKSHLLFEINGRHWVASTGFSVLRCREGVTNPQYLFFQLFGHGISRQIEALLTGTSYPAINSRDVRGLEIPFTTYEEQTAIATVLSDMATEIAALVQRRDKTRAIKQGMMQELLTGRVRLPVRTEAEAVP